MRKTHVTGDAVTSPAGACTLRRLV